MTQDPNDIDLDRLLERVPLAEPPAGLAERILANAPEPASAHRARQIKDWFRDLGWRWPAPAALASLAMGMLAGYAAASPEVTSERDEQFDTYVMAGFGEGWAETMLIEDSIE